ncbi:MAG: hypothetical protein FWF31_04490 [Desulfobulbus sp.]|nr:hypothetical protein [Desulfobulbus sp.]
MVDLLAKVEWMAVDKRSSGGSITLQGERKRLGQGKVLLENKQNKFVAGEPKKNSPWSKNDSAPKGRVVIHARRSIGCQGPAREVERAKGVDSIVFGVRLLHQYGQLTNQEAGNG